MPVRLPRRYGSDGAPRGVSNALSAAHSRRAAAKRADNSSGMGGNLAGAETGARPHPQKMGRARCHRARRACDRGARAVLYDDVGNFRHESRRRSAV